MGRDEITRVSSPSAIAEYLQMVAMVSGEGVLDVEVEKVSARVDEWIASLPQNMKLQVSRRLFASAFFTFCFRTASSITSFLVTLAVNLGMSAHGKYLMFGWLTNTRVIVPTGPPRARIGQKSQKSTARP